LENKDSCKWEDRSTNWEKEVTDTPSGRYPPLCRLPAQLLTPFANTAQQKTLMEKRCVSSALAACRLLETTSWNAVWLRSIQVLYFARLYHDMHWM